MCTTKLFQTSTTCYPNGVCVCDRVCEHCRMNTHYNKKPTHPLEISGCTAISCSWYQSHSCGRESSLSTTSNVQNIVQHTIHNNIYCVQKCKLTTPHISEHIILQLKLFFLNWWCTQSNQKRGASSSIWAIYILCSSDYDQWKNGNWNLLLWTEKNPA